MNFPVHGADQAIKVAILVHVDAERLRKTDTGVECRAEELVAGRPGHGAKQAAVTAELLEGPRAVAASALILPVLDAGVPRATAIPADDAVNVAVVVEVGAEGGCIRLGCSKRCPRLRCEISRYERTLASSARGVIHRPVIQAVQTTEAFRYFEVQAEWHDSRRGGDVLHEVPFLLEDVISYRQRIVIVKIAVKACVPGSIPNYTIQLLLPVAEVTACDRRMTRPHWTPECVPVDLHPRPLRRPRRRPRRRHGRYRRC